MNELTKFGFIKMAFWDLPSSLTDIYFDFSVGLDLVFSSEVEKSYGWMSLILNWIPGLVVFFHVISSNRESQSKVKTVIFALLSLITYPVLLSFSILYALINRPKNSRGTEQFKYGLKFVTVLQAISGCFEAPLQMTYNLHLILNGILPSSFGVKCVFFEDMNGNQLCVPTSASLSIIFSLLATMMAVFSLNLPQNTQSSNIPRQLQYGPFLMIATCFKISSLVVITSITTWSIIPIIALIVANIILHEVLLSEEHRAPKWILTTSSLFVPFLPISQNGRKSKMYFALQMLLSIFINGITILVFYVLVVKSLLKLNGNFILDDLTFNILVWYTLAMGLVSLVTMIPKFFTCSLIEKFKLIWSIIWATISMVLLTSFVLLLILASGNSTKGIT